MNTLALKIIQTPSGPRFWLQAGSRIKRLNGNCFLSAQASLWFFGRSGRRAQAQHCAGIWRRALIRIENLVRCHGFVSLCWPRGFCSSLLMNDVEALVCYAETCVSVWVQIGTQSPLFPPQPHQRRKKKNPPTTVTCMFKIEASKHIIE